MRMIYLWIWCLGKRGSLIDHVSHIRLLWECVSWFQCHMITGCPRTRLSQTDKKSTSNFFRNSNFPFCPFIKAGPKLKFSKWLSLKVCIWYQSKHLYSGQEWSSRASQSQWEQARDTQLVYQTPEWLSKTGNFFISVSKSYDTNEQGKEGTNWVCHSFIWYIQSHPKS